MGRNDPEPSKTIRRTKCAIVTGPGYIAIFITVNKRTDFTLIHKNNKKQETYYQLTGQG